MRYLVPMTDSPHDILRKARLARGFQFASELAKATGWNESTYRSHENGSRPMTLAAAKRYAPFLGLEVTDLYRPEHIDLQVSLPTVEMIGRAAFGIWRDTRIEKDERRTLGMPGWGGVMRKAVEVVDDSVNRYFVIGDFAVYEAIGPAEIEDLKSGYVVVERSRDTLIERTIRKVRKRSDRLELLTDSHDPKFTEIVSYPSQREGETVTIIGRVVGRYSEL